MSKLFTLQDYIELRTGAALARDLELDEQTIYNWKAKRSSPRPVVAARIISISGGLLTWQGIYQPFVDFQNDQQLSFDFKD